MVSPSHISPLLMCSDTEVCILSWAYFVAAVIYLAVGRPIEHLEMGHAYLAAGSPPYVLMTVYPAAGYSMHSASLLLVGIFPVSSCLLAVQLCLIYMTFTKVESALFVHS
jgi:hypothetical protein